jgi:hypothetical protein
MLAFDFKSIKYYERFYNLEILSDRMISTPMYYYAGVDTNWFGYWLDAYLSVPSKTWKWTDGSLSSFRPWAPGL